MRDRCSVYDFDRSRRRRDWIILIVAALAIAGVILSALPEAHGAELTPASPPAGACGPDYPGKRAFMDFCRVLRRAGGQDLYRACLRAGKICEKTTAR